MTDAIQDQLFPELPVLLVDDDFLVLETLKEQLGLKGVNNVLMVENSTEVETVLDCQDVALVVLDLTMPGKAGNNILKDIVRDYPELPVIILTGTGDMETAVQCIKLGAYDYHAKPPDMGKFVRSIHNAYEKRRLTLENQRLKDVISSDKQAPLENVITCDRGMNSIFSYARKIAMSDLPILVSGETGVGKELLIQGIYELSGCKGPLVSLNISGIEDSKLNDTLFGHVESVKKGTGSVRDGLVERARDGFLCLDEIGDLSELSQVKLLRLIDSREFRPLGEDTTKQTNARFIFTTNKDIMKLVQEGKFRKDLYYRLNSHHIHLPALRSRKGDIKLLLNHFIKEASESLGKSFEGSTTEVFNILSEYSFPGNVRELKSIVYDLVIQSKDELSPDVVSDYVDRNNRIQHSGDDSGSGALRFSSTLPTIKECTRLLVEEAMRRSGRNQSVASKMLGISQQALSQRLKKNPGSAARKA